jgi:hypothetical protein
LFTRKAIAGLVSALAMMAVVSDAMAQSADSTSTSTSGAAANSGSRSSSIGAGSSRSTSAAAQTNNNQQGVRSTTNTGVTLNQNSYTGSGGDPGGLGGANGHNGNGAYGSTAFSQQNGDVTVRTTPTVYAPPVSGGNPCTLAVSGGASFIGWGAALGGTFVDPACARRQQIAMLHNAGYPQAARELACEDRETYVAFKTVGQPCAFRAQFEAQGATPTPTPQPIPPLATTAAPAFQPTGRFACMDARGREVAVGTPGASCGQI